VFENRVLRRICRPKGQEDGENCTMRSLIISTLQIKKDEWRRACSIGGERGEKCRQCFHLKT
jgi:hypothetical protein